MRLLITKTPERRQLGLAGELSVFGQEHSWFLGDYEENVERQSACGISGDKFAFGASEIECAKGLMKVKTPARSANEPRNGNASAVSAELVAALAAAHGVGGTAAVELRAAFAETQESGVSDRKGDGAGFGVDDELLKGFAFCAFDDGTEWIERKLYVAFADFDGAFVLSACKFRQRRSPVRLHERAVAFDRLRLPFFQWKDAEPKSVGAHRGNLNFYGTTGDLKILLRGFVLAWQQKIGSTDGTDAFKEVTAIVTVGHLLQHPKERRLELFPEKRSRDYTRKYGR